MRLVRPLPARFDGVIEIRRTYSERAADPRPLDLLRAVSGLLGNAVARSRGLSPFSREGTRAIRAVEKRIDASKTRHRGQDITTFQREQCEQMASLLTDLGVQAATVDSGGDSIPAVAITGGSGHSELDRILFTALAPNALPTTFVGEYALETRRFSFAGGRVRYQTDAYPLAS